MNFKEIKYLNLKWLRNSSESGGAMKEIIQNKKINEVVIHSHTEYKGRLWCSTTPDTLLNLITTKNYGIYEVITSYPHKVYFDIDCYKKDLSNCEVETPKELLNNINKLILYYFKDAEIAFSGSVTDEKISFHVVVNNYHISNQEEREEIKILATFFNTYIQYPFDSAVYTNNRNFKAINQAKLDGRIQSIIYNNDPKKHIITCFLNENILPFPNFELIDDDYLDFKMDDNIKTNKVLNLGLLPKLDNLIIAPDFDLTLAKPIGILKLIPLNSTDKAFDHSYNHRVARYCFHNELTINDFLSWYA